MNWLRVNILYFSTHNIHAGPRSPFRSIAFDVIIASEQLFSSFVKLMKMPPHCWDEKWFGRERLVKIFVIKKKRNMCCNEAKPRKHIQICTKQIKRISTFLFFSTFNILICISICDVPHMGEKKIVMRPEKVEKIWIDYIICLDSFAMCRFIYEHTKMLLLSTKFSSISYSSFVQGTKTKSMTGEGFRKTNINPISFILNNRHSYINTQHSSDKQRNQIYAELKKNLNGIFLA